MTNCAAEWAGAWGDNYTARNRVDWRSRVPFWRNILDVTGARSVYEVGCNAGFNLSAIKRAYPDVRAYGVEINRTAAVQASMAGHSSPFCREVVDALDRVIVSNLFDLACTAGVLIHIPPDRLRDFMEVLVEASADYVLAVEYAADKEEEVEYRGRAGMLWRRPYGRLYEEMGLKLVRTGDAGHAFDRCTYWLLKK